MAIKFITIKNNKMREIKFRAWNGVNMVDLYRTTPLALKSDFNIDGLFIPFHTDYILMQYTGLKDLNGVDGYHNDIVKSGKRIYLIHWQEEESRFLLSPYKGTNDWQFMDMLKSFEIIGNIYENPELLK